MPPQNASTITSPSCANASSSAAAQLEPALAGLADADRAAEPRGLDEHRVAEAGQLVEHRAGLAPPARLAQRDRADLRHAGGGHHVLEDDLVHAQRGRQHAGADVRHVEQLEQALDGAVLAERAVQDGEDGVGVEHAVPGLERHLRAVVRPTRRRARSSPEARRGPPPRAPRARTPRSSARPRARRTGRRRGRRPSRLTPSASVVGVGVGVAGVLERADDDRHARAGRALVVRPAGSGRAPRRPRPRR